MPERAELLAELRKIVWGMTSPPIADGVNKDTVKSVNKDTVKSVNNLLGICHRLVPRPDTFAPALNALDLCFRLAALCPNLETDVAEQWQKKLNDVRSRLLWAR